MWKKNLSIMFILLVLSIFICPNVYAFDSSTYRYRELCGNYELAEVNGDGSIIAKGCYATYAEAKQKRIELGSDNLVIMIKSGGETKIIDANIALLDLTVNPEGLTYFYTNKELKGSYYTYMDNSSSYGGVDGALLDVDYSNLKGTWVAKVQIANFIGWIPLSAYEIVPITWVKSASYYTVTSTDIRHYYVSKIQNTYTGTSGRTIGPKPEMLSPGNYYSYDGHYFYTNLATLIKDNKNNTHANAVNKDKPYYNYYMYLSNHTRTAYSSLNIDEYIRNNLGYTGDVYGNAANSGTSRLYGKGTFFYYAQEKYGVNAILSLSLSRNETGNGRSNLSINKNNGFGLNAVDSNPTQAANWYASFSSSILGYASKWITYGYAHPRDWRYFGPQFGNKWIGMNVEYASDTYWSEKMAANYYSLDKAFGMQDYNYYQLGVVNGKTNAYLGPSTSSKFIYNYTEKEDAVVIVEEVTQNNEKWYKVVSDINLDSNGNELTSGAYNWNSYVYVKASDVTKINTSKNGYISPNSIFEYEDKSYEYDLYIVNTELKPKTAITLKDTPYYYDSTLTSKTGKTVLKSRYVMVYSAALKDNLPIAYLITSDYWHDQKHWVSADSIKFVTMSYGKASVTAPGNQYTWVNYNTEDASYSIISGLYTNTYVPILESVKVGGNTWYKVPVNLTGNDNQYGYTLSSTTNVQITAYTSQAGNNKPVILAKDQTLLVNATFDPKKEVTASDAEDGDLTSKIEITENTVNTKVAGTYKVTYKVTDSASNTITKTIKVTVKENQAPVINAKDVKLYIGDTFDPKKDVTATDSEDGNLTSKIQIVTNTVDTTKVGIYKVIYKVTDNNNKTTTKEIKVTVIEKVSTALTKENFEVLQKNTEPGEFYLDSITWNQEKKLFTISGYCILLNQENGSDKTYTLVLVNKETKDIYTMEIDSWKNNTPYDLGKENGYSYTNSWFKGTMNLTNITNGDYSVYLFSTTNNHFTLQMVNNFLNRPITRRGEDSNHGYNFKVQQRTRTKELEISIRDRLYTTSESPTTRNMVNGYDEIKFVENKLYMLGYSYDYEGVYNNQSAITRKLIIENNTNYKQTVSDLGSTKGPFELVTLDKKDKTYAWFEKSIDISKLEKGTYTLYIYTKTSNAENYDEIPDMLKRLNVSETINGKTYTVYCNRNRNNRIELKVE